MSNLTTPAIVPTTTPTEVDRHQTAQIRWLKVGVILAAVGTIFSVVISVFAAPLWLLVLEDWRAPSLSYKTNEYILINGRVLEVQVINNGNRPAKDVVLTIDDAADDFEFLDIHHVHSEPTTAVEVTMTKRRLDVKLRNPLGPHESVRFTLDNVEYKPTPGRLFLTGVSFERGQATNFGSDLHPFSKMTLKEYMRPRSAAEALSGL